MFHVLVKTFQDVGTRLVNVVVDVLVVLDVLEHSFDNLVIILNLNVDDVLGKIHDAKRKNGWFLHPFVQKVLHYQQRIERIQQRFLQGNATLESKAFLHMTSFPFTTP